MQETPEYLNDTAVRLAASGDHEQAIACLRKALRHTPRSSILWFNLALSYRALGRMTGAREALFKALEINPLDVDSLDTLAVILRESGEDTAAEELYRRALDLAPGNGRIWNNFGVLCFTEARYEEAREAFEKAVALVPDFDDALYNLRDTYEELGRDDDRSKCAAILARRGFRE
jgi:Tfp pilus assembly protein PilF